MNEVFDSGEKEIQGLLGETTIANRNGAVITNSIIKGAINFIEKQPMAIVSSKNKEGEVWISLLIGNYGFTSVPNPNAIAIDLENITSNKNDVFFDNIQHHTRIGSLFIELDTRRRFRINGVSQTKDSQINITIEEAYPNCPKYIQRRVVSLPEHFKKTSATKVEEIKLTKLAIDWIENADTFFIGSSNNEGKLDASHRGGNPGFIEVINKNILKIPDYSGNSLYNTFGNISQNPNVGILFIDFEKRQTLQITGEAELLFNQRTEKDMIKTNGTGRYLIFKPLRWIQTINHHFVDWNFLEYSPFNP